MRSLRLVVDASVATSAGEQNKRGEGCRKVLQEILEICHHLTMTDRIFTEWRSHCQKFARQWRVSMYARKKVDWVPSDEDEPLQSRIVRALARPKEQAVVKKDMHLIHAALFSDCIVLSADEVAPGCFSKAAATVNELERIGWANPASQSEDIVGWLKSAGKPRRRFSLGKDG